MVAACRFAYVRIPSNSRQSPAPESSAHELPIIENRRRKEKELASVLRGIVLAILAALLLIALMTTSAYAQSRNSAVTSGLTSLDSVFQDGTYTWTLTNNSSLPGDMEPSFDILVWGLIPYHVPEPTSWTAPEGWRWAHDAWELLSPNRKYYTPNALAPGASIVFRYTPKPEGKLVNANGLQPERLGFIAHAAAVVPGSGTEDGSVRWIPTATPYGDTWYDTPVADGSTLIPEAKGLLVMALGICTVGSRLIRSSRR